MSTILFKDIYKPVKDFFNKNHNGDKYRVDVKSKVASNGTVLNVLGERKANKSDIGGELSFEYDLECYTPFKLKTLAKTDGSIQNTLTFNKLYPGLKVETVGTVSTAETKQKDTIEKTLEYTTNGFSLTSKITCNDYTLPLDVEGSAVGGYNDFSFGGSAALDSTMTQLKKFSLGFRYFTKDNTVAGLLENNEIAKLGYVHALNSQTSLGGEYDMLLTGKPGEKITLSVGAEHKVNSDLTIKGKLNTKGIFATSFTQSLAPSLKGVVSAEVDCAKYLQSAPLKWGVVFTYDQA